MNAKERLESIDDYRSAIERLTSSNTALLSANADLRSANDTLHSSLEQLNSMIDGTRLPVMLLDRHLTIRAYTPGVGDIFDIGLGDRGRPLTDIAHHLADLDLSADLRAVLHTGEARTRRVMLANGRAHYLLTIRPIANGKPGSQGVVLLLVDITAMVRVEEQKNVLIAELNHRVKNMLALIIAIARQTIRRAPTANAFYEAFAARLHAMARTYELLSRESWSEVSLGALLEQELTPYVSEVPGRTTLAGPHIMLKPKMALSLGLIFHELATNAAKYGALSNTAGTVAVNWKREERPPKKFCLMLEWLERNGPRVAAPEKSGFGLDLVCNEANYSLRGKATLRFEQEGLAVALEIPLGD